MLYKCSYINEGYFTEFCSRVDGITTWFSQSENAARRSLSIVTE